MLADVYGYPSEYVKKVTGDASVIQERLRRAFRYLCKAIVDQITKEVRKTWKKIRYTLLELEWRVGGGERKYSR